MRKFSPIKIDAAFVGVAFLWASTTGIVPHLSRLSAPEIAGWRGALGALTLIAVPRYLRSVLRWRPTQSNLWLLFAVASTSYCYVICLVETNSAISQGIYYGACPPFLIALAYFVAREIPSRADLLFGGLLSLAAGGLALSGMYSLSLWGVFAGILASLFYAAELIALRLVEDDEERLATMIVALFLQASLFIFSPPVVSSYTLKEFSLLMLLGVLTMGLPTWFYGMLVPCADNVRRVGVVMSIEPVLAVVIGVFVGSVYPTSFEVILCLAITGVVVGRSAVAARKGG